MIAYLNRRRFLRPLSLLHEEAKEACSRFVFIKEFHGLMMFEPVSDTIEKLQASGIIKHLVSKYLELKVIPDDVEPKVLTLNHLGICFVVCSAVAALSFVTFFAEMYAKMFVRAGKWLIRTIVANGIIKAFVSIRNAQGNASV